MADFGLWPLATTGRTALYLPSLLSLQLPDDVGDLPAVLVKPVGAHPQAWVCRGPQCLPPIADIESLVAALAQ